MRVHIDQSSRARDRRVVRRVLVQRNAHKAPQRQRVRQPPGNPALRPDALEIANQQRPEIDARRQRRPPVLLRIELRAPGSRPTRRTPPLLAIHSASGKTDAPAPPLTPAARSITLLASPAACACPSPCPHSTNHPCASHNLFRSANPDLHHGLSGQAKCWK